MLERYLRAIESDRYPRTLALADYETSVLRTLLVVSAFWLGGMRGDRLQRAVDNALNACRSIAA